MKDRNKFLGMIAVFAVIGLAFTACGGNDDDYRQYGNFRWRLDNGEATIVGYTGHGGAVNIPAQINNRPVTTIYRSAFENRQLTSVVIPDSVTYIGNIAFRNNQLTSIVIPNSITSIGREAFLGNPLTNIIIEGNGVTLGLSPFIGNFHLAYRGIAGTFVRPRPTVDYSRWERLYGYFLYLINFDTNQVIITGFSGSERNIVIPSTLQNIPVTLIDFRAFENRQLTSVVIPDSVIDIRSNAFANNQLTNVTFSNNVAFTWGSAFSDNPAFNLTITGTGEITSRSVPIEPMNNVTIGDGITSIGENAFWGSQLTSVTIPNSVTSIGNRAFFRSQQLTSVTIPDSVTTIGDWAFSDSQLTSVIIGNSVTTIGNSVFRDNQLTSVVIPNSVTSIGGGAFMNNQLTSVTIGANVTVSGYDWGTWHAFDAGFTSAYNAAGRQAGTYTRPNTLSTVWTRQ